ncbi:unnamed protein product, partial [Timema podura]|nr:unnamed protein product [Timema podura]
KLCFFQLTPDDKVIHKEFEKEMKEAKEYVRKLNIISTNPKDKDDVIEEKENVKEKYGLNQKFGLCEALLKVGDWTHAEQLTKKLPDHCMLEQHPVAWALCQLLHAVIEPVYRKHCLLAPQLLGDPVPPPGGSLAPKHCLLAPQLLGDPVPPPGGSLAPKCANTFQELKEHAIPMMVALGTSMHYDPVLMYKVLRLTHAALTQ